MNNSNNPNRSAGVDKRVSKITGDPKKAIRSLSVPIIMSLLLMMAYNLADSIWVAGLGPNSLAALGFITPLFMMVIGLGNGVGAGANSLISRCIGAKNKKGSDNAAIHSIILSLIISAILTIFLLIFLQNILLAMQVGVSLSLAMEYGQIVFGGLIFLIFTSVASGILRAEGDFKRPMYAMAATAVLNIILDPIFIYYFGWGVSGAAMATVISSMISSALIFYWLLIKRDTYVSLSRKDFHASWNVTKDILNVGLPASAEYFVMAILGIILNLMLVITGGTEAVAVYTAGWRVVSIAMIPAIGIGMAAITVAGASYGSKRYDNVSTVLNYSGKLAIGVALITGLIIYVFALNIASIFAYSSESAFMAPSIAAFLQVMCLFLIVVSLGIIASSIFQGMGKGLTSLILTVIREVLFISVFAYTFSIILGLGEHGVWWGIVIGSVFGNSIAYIWAWKYIDRLKKNYKTGNIEI
ncbi:MATE family efflux transporter [Methanobacterium sp.]|uniref:MATE family efflux transporter n=1 Tax=Methanobacterium sp. TaxID=2164 RepID=UPI002ABBEC66|nr:MATE family efflux transporter [Methanobacterium sp.]MDY9922760.1 MATE family efflux transporter [Methanobacterium sp.]